MAELFGDNYTRAYLSNGEQKANVGDWAGRIRVLLDSKTTVVVADVLSIGRLPKGARVLSVNHIGGGVSPTFNVAPMDVMTADETIITITIGATPGATVHAWVEYTID